MGLVLFWAADEKALFSQAGRFDAWSLAWRPAPAPERAESVTALEALERLAAGEGMRRVPVGVVGPKVATTDALRTAEYVGAQFARLGLQLLCGGKGGVMEAACRGNFQAGGMPIGLLPDDEWAAANDFVAIPVPTGIGPARNAIIARGCQLLIAIGGGHGTLSEMALGLHFNRPVISLENAPTVEGATVCASADDALQLTAEHILRPPIS